MSKNEKLSSVQDFWARLGSFGHLGLIIKTHKFYITIVNLDTFDPSRLQSMGCLSKYLSVELNS